MEANLEFYSEEHYRKHMRHNSDLMIFPPHSSKSLQGNFLHQSWLFALKHRRWSTTPESPPGDCTDCEEEPGCEMYLILGSVLGVST